MFLWSFSVNLQAFYHKCYSLIGCATHYLVMWSIYEIIHIWTAARWKWRMIIAVNLIGKRKPEKIRASTGFEPAILVRCATDWAMQPHVGSKVNLRSSYLLWGVKWCEVYMKEFIFELRVVDEVKNDHRSKFSNIFNNLWSSYLLRWSTELLT